MALSRKKITTTTVEEEEYDHYDRGAVGTTTNAATINDAVNNNKTGEQKLSDAPAQTSSLEENNFSGKVGKTWPDYFYSIKESYFFHVYVLIFFYVLAYFLVTHYFNSCSLLNTYRWLLYIGGIGSFFSVLYIVALIYKKVKKIN